MPHEHWDGQKSKPSYIDLEDCESCMKRKARMESPEYKAAQERFRAMQEQANPVVAAIDAKFPPRPVTWTDGSEIEVDEDRLIREPYAIPGKPPTWGEVGIIALMVVGMFVGAIAAGGL